MNFRLLLLLSLLSAIITIYSCKKDDPDTKTYDVPTTYNFDSVDYSGQTARLDMLGELSVEMKKGNTKGTPVSAVLLKNMYANVGSPFVKDSLNTSGKKLKDKHFFRSKLFLKAIWMHWQQRVNHRWMVLTV